MAVIVAYLHNQYMQVSNKRIVNLDGPDFYPTPPWAVEALLSVETVEGSIWEPACGNGAISHALESTGKIVYSSDLHSHGYGTVGEDFLLSQRRADVIITNPPYNIGESFVQHGLRQANDKLILLLRLSFLESVRRYHSIYTVHRPCRVWLFTQRLSMYPEGQPVKGGGTTSYGWFVWDVNKPRSETVLGWIAPGFKR